MKYILNSILSTAYWRYIFSFEGLKSIFAIFGTIWLIAETLDFFKVYTRDQYGSYAFFIFMVLSVIFSILLKRPIKSISVSFPEYDFSIDVRIADLFSLSGATMISTNTQFEADVAGGRIAVDSLQGQFTAKYFTGNQIELIKNLQEKLTDFKHYNPLPDWNYNSNSYSWENFLFYSDVHPGRRWKCFINYFRNRCFIKRIMGLCTK